MSTKNRGGRPKRDDVAIPTLSSRTAAKHRIEVSAFDGQSARTVVASSSKRKRQTPHDLDDPYRDFDPEACGEMLDFQSGRDGADDNREEAPAMRKRYTSSVWPFTPISTFHLTDWNLTGRTNGNLEAARR